MARLRKKKRTSAQQFIIDRTTIDHNGCWIWQGQISPQGYGKYYNVLAHRMSYAAFVGKPGEAILHRCDVRSCCNPNHLISGTRALNNEDCARKMRRAGLSRETVLSIYNDKRSGQAIADELGIYRSRVNAIKNGRAYRHITGHGA
jgi:hypothetical protein